MSYADFNFFHSKAEAIYRRMMDKVLVKMPREWSYSMYVDIKRIDYIENKVSVNFQLKNDDKLRRGTAGAVCTRMAIQSHPHPPKWSVLI